jgi:hypothetical protein
MRYWTATAGDRRLYRDCQTPVAIGFAPGVLVRLGVWAFGLTSPPTTPDPIFSRLG